MRTLAVFVVFFLVSITHAFGQICKEYNGAGFTVPQRNLLCKNAVLSRYAHDQDTAIWKSADPQWFDAWSQPGNPVPTKAQAVGVLVSVNWYSTPKFVRQTVGKVVAFGVGDAGAEVELFGSCIVTIHVNSMSCYADGGVAIDVDATLLYHY